MEINILGDGVYWTINKHLVKQIGIEASLLLTDLIGKHNYFLKHKQITEDGYFFNTVENIEKDTTLTKYKQSESIKILEEKNLISTKLIGIPAKRHFCINIDVLLVLMRVQQEVKKPDNKKSKNQTCINKNKVNKNKKYQY